MRNTAGKVRTNSWATYSGGFPSHRWAKAWWLARTYIQQLSADTGYSLEDPPRTMGDRNGGERGSGRSLLAAWYDDDIIKWWQNLSRKRRPIKLSWILRFKWINRCEPKCQTYCWLTRRKELIIRWILLVDHWVNKRNRNDRQIHRSCLRAEKQWQMKVKKKKKRSLIPPKI